MLIVIIIILLQSVRLQKHTQASLYINKEQIRQTLSLTNNSLTRQFIALLKCLWDQKINQTLREIIAVSPAFKV